MYLSFDYKEEISKIKINVNGKIETIYEMNKVWPCNFDEEKKEVFGSEDAFEIYKSCKKDDDRIEEKVVIRSMEVLSGEVYIKYDPLTITEEMQELRSKKRVHYSHFSIFD